MASINPGQQTKGIALMFMACFSVGVIETCSLALAPLACPSEDLGAALGALGSIRSGGAAVATAIYVTILTNKLTKFVPEYVAPAAIQAGLPKSFLPDLFKNLATNTLQEVPGINAKIIAAVGAANASAAADAFRYVEFFIDDKFVLKETRANYKLQVCLVRRDSLRRCLYRGSMLDYQLR
jgi:hypothetical protein